MTQTPEDFVLSMVRLVSIGSFITVFQNAAYLAQLREYAERPDWLGLQSRAILAEVYDQVGLYKRAEELVPRDLGGAQLAKLQDAIEQKAERRVVRAHAWLILQCAVSQFRTTNGRDCALSLLECAITIIEHNKGEALSSLHIQSLMLFWRGRIHTARYAFKEAEEDFKTALTVADSTLKEKLRMDEHIPNEAERERKKVEHITAGNYVLFTIFGFGLGQLLQMQGRLLDSLQFLRVAVPLSRGSGDFHRRGYAHLLMGTAMRSQNRLDAADEELKEAERLFGAVKKCGIPPHNLHLARVYHQLALSRYNRVPPEGPRSPGDIKALQEADQMNNRARSLSRGKDYLNYQDPVLEYGITVAQSLIATSRDDHQTARRAADEAIHKINTGTNVPALACSWAWLAKGMAIAKAIRSSGQSGEIKDAETAFKAVLVDKNARSTDMAAAHLHLSWLYLRIGQAVNAAIHFDLATPLVKLSEHGWIKDLHDTVKRAATNSLSSDLSLNLKELLATGKKQPKAWAYIEDFVGIEVKRRILWLHRDLIEKRDAVGKIATALNVSRGTIHIWKKDPRLKDLFGPMKHGH